MKKNYDKTDIDIILEAYTDSYIRFKTPGIKSEIEDFFKNPEEIKPYEWVGLAIRYPEIVDTYDKFDELNSEQWRQLLYFQPQFAVKAKKTAPGQAALITLHPKFIKLCNKFNEFTDEDWRMILDEHPEFYDIAYKYGFNPDWGPDTFNL